MTDSFEKKLTTFVNYFSTNFPQGDKLTVTYKYILEKTISVWLNNVSTITLQSIQKIKDKFELVLLDAFNIQFGNKNPSYFAVNIPKKRLEIIIIDISKINYKVYELILPKNKYSSSDCDNYFCSFKEYKNVCLGFKKFIYLELYNEAFNRVRGLDFEKYSQESVRERICDLFYVNMPSKDWIDSQIKYLNSLDILSKKIVNLYSKTGDKLMNLYLRNSNKIDDNIYNLFINNYKDNATIYIELMKTNEVNQKNVEIYIKKLINRLKFIIDNSPLTEKAFYVYRGRTDQPIPDEKYNSDSFLSTSLLTKIAVNFSKDQKLGTHGTIFRFKIRSKCLLISNSKYLTEYEILLPFGERYLLKSNNINSEFIDGGGDKVEVNYVEYS